MNIYTAKIIEDGQEVEVPIYADFYSEAVESAHALYEDVIEVF